MCDDKKNWSFFDANDFNGYPDKNLKRFDYLYHELVLNKKHLYLYTQAEVANIYIINSNNGLLLHKLCDVFPCGEREDEIIVEVIDYENSILATCSGSKQLIFFDVKVLQSETQKIHCQENICTEIKLDKNLLYCASLDDTEIITWNLDAWDREEQRFKLDNTIYLYEIKSPYLFVTLSGDDHHLMIFNMLEKKLDFIKQIDFKFGLDEIIIVRNVFFISDVDYKGQGFYYSLFLLDEIVDETVSITYEEMTTQKMKISNFEIFGSYILTKEWSGDEDEHEAKCIVKKSFWP